AERSVVLLQDAQRAGRVAGTLERSGEPHGHWTAHRVDRLERSPPSDRRAVVATFLGPHGQTVEAGGVGLVEIGPLGFRPALELGRTGNVEAVQKRPATERDGRLVVMPRKAGTKVENVATDDV